MSSPATPPGVISSWISTMRVAALATLGILAIGFLDLFIPPDFGLSPFYAIFIYWAARKSGWGWGSFTILLSAFVWMKAEQRAGALRQSDWMIYWNTGVRLCFFALVVYLAHVQRSLTVEKTKSNTDALTGLLNRRGFERKASLALNLCHRHERPLSVLYADCDNFKAINDTMGHPVGNLLLQTVGKVLSRETRSFDVAARLGGDEFAILMPETDQEHACLLVERLRRRLQEAMQDKNWPVTISMGLVTYCTPPSTLHEVMREADRLMYRAKALNKGGLDSAVFADERPS